MSRKTKILFVRLWHSSFIQQDLEILNKYFDVKVVDTVLARKDLSGTLKTLFNLFKGTIRADITVSWFAGYHSALALVMSKIFRKKMIVIIAGGDVASEPDIDYGAMRDPGSFLARITRFTLNNSDAILPVSNYNRGEVLKHSDPKKLKVIHCGVDEQQFDPGNEKKENLAITIGAINRMTLRRKGLETFVKAAGFLPETRFAVIGKPTDDALDYLKTIAGSNVEFTGFISVEELLEYTRRAKVYVQASAHEGFGVSVAEAMLCQCVPVVTERGSLPEVVGDTGYFVPYEDPEAAAAAIARAMESENGNMARQRVLDNFTLQKRETALIQFVGEIRLGGKLER